MKGIACFFNIFLFILLLVSACTDPTDIGADLLEGDEAEVGFTDTLSVRATTLKTDTILTYVRNPDQAYSGYLFGRMQDPVFGISKAQIYAQMASANTSPNSSHRFDSSASLDSIVLVLPYDRAGIYGDTTETYGISVNRLSEFINQENYYSNAAFASAAIPLGTKEFVPNLDSITIYDYAIADTTKRLKVPAQLRINLDPAFGQELIKLDTNFYNANSNFDSLLVQYLKGLHLKPTTTNRGMLSFNLISSRAGVYLYYKEQYTLNGAQRDTLKQIRFNFDPFWTRATSLEHDYRGALVERYIDNTQLGDSLVFVQGMAGVVTDLEIPFAEKLQGLVVNKAELELRIASPPGNSGDIFPPVPLILVLSPDENGAFYSIDDVSLILTRLGIDNLKKYYGGGPVTGNAGEPQLYRINLSTHFQDVINKKKSNVLRLIAFNRLQQPARVVLYGAKHPQYAIKLKVAFTRPPGG